MRVEFKIFKNIQDIQGISKLEQLISEFADRLKEPDKYNDFLDFHDRCVSDIDTIFNLFDEFSTQDIEFGTQLESFFEVYSNHYKFNRVNVLDNIQKLEDPIKAKGLNKNDEIKLFIEYFNKNYKHDKKLVEYRTKYFNNSDLNGLDPTIHNNLYSIF